MRASPTDAEEVLRKCYGALHKSGDPAIDSMVEKVRQGALTRSVAEALSFDIQALARQVRTRLDQSGNGGRPCQTTKVYRHLGDSAWTRHGVRLNKTEPPLTSA